MTLREFTAGGGRWDRGRRERMKESSRKSADRALRVEILPLFGDVELDAIDPAAVSEWFDNLAARVPHGATRTLDVFRTICRYAVQLGLLAADPTRRCRRIPSRKVTRYLSKSEVGRLHDALDAYRSRFGRHDQADIIRLLLLTGCRCGEIIALRWDEVDMKAGCLRLKDSKTGPRTVWLGAEALSIIETLSGRSESRWVFPDRRNPRRHRSKDLSAWKRIRAAAGIEDCRIHDLRHTYASHALMSGVPMPVVARLLGHADVKMTMRYAHVGDRETQAAADRIGSALVEVLEGSPRP